MIHDLKIRTLHFNDILNGSKTFEIRDNRDRNFSLHDDLLLREITGQSQTAEYTGRAIKAHVNSIVRGGFDGILPEYLCVMSIVVTSSWPRWEMLTREGEYSVFERHGLRRVITGLTLKQAEGVLAVLNVPDGDETW
jgi:hypothetical protein